MNKILVNIITDLGHPENIDLILASILNAKKDLPIDFHWYFLCDEKLERKLPFSHSYETSIKEGIIKHGRINKVLEKIHSGFVYFLNSDNLLHPDLLHKFYSLWEDAQSNKEPFDGIIVKQLLEDDTVRSVRIRPGDIDAAQYIVSKDAIGTSGWHSQAFDADGYFIEKIYNENENSIKIVQEPLAYYKKIEEYKLLLNAPVTFQENSIVVPDRGYFEKNIKPSPNPLLRATKIHLGKLCGLKLRVIRIMGNVVNVISLRKSHPCYKAGNGILLIFESPEHMKNCLKLAACS